MTPPQRILVFKYPSRDRVNQHFMWLQTIVTSLSKILRVRPSIRFMIDQLYPCVKYRMHLQNWKGGGSNNHSLENYRYYFLGVELCPFLNKISFQWITWLQFDVLKYFRVFVILIEILLRWIIFVLWFHNQICPTYLTNSTPFHSNQNNKCYFYLH